MPDIKFGTDGWRAQIGDEFTLRNVGACAQGVSAFIRATRPLQEGVIVGYDTRHLSLEAGLEAARVITSNGITTYLCKGVAPTPVVSFNILHRNAAGGVVITASHNPSTWNGFKYKPSYAGSASPSIVKELERHIKESANRNVEDRWDLDSAAQKGLLVYIDPAQPYTTHLANNLDLDRIQNSGLRVLVDSMHGAGGGYIATILAGNSTSVNELRSEPDPTFPGMVQPEPIAHNLGPSTAAIRSGRYDVGIATDGDADRLGIMNEQGEFISTLQVFALLCFHQLEILGRRGPIVRSVTQSSMVDKLGAQYDVPVHVTPVGFKFLGPVMQETNALLAGEESGGYAFMGNIPERDGIFSALVFLELMIRTGKTPSELVRSLHEKVGPHHYERVDIPITPAQQARLRPDLIRTRPRTLGGLNIIDHDSTDGLKVLLEDGFWGLIRQSGTEPLLRLYAEADSAPRARKVLADLRSNIGI